MILLLTSKDIDNRNDINHTTIDSECDNCHNSMDMDSKMTNKVHKCDVCGKTFSKSKGLAGHRLTHRGECPHVCVFCDKRFYVRSNLTAHLRIHTGNDF